MKNDDASRYDQAIALLALKYEKVLFAMTMLNDMLADEHFDAAKNVSAKTLEEVYKFRGLLHPAPAKKEELPKNVCIPANNKKAVKIPVNKEEGSLAAMDAQAEAEVEEPPRNSQKLSGPAVTADTNASEESGLV